MLFANITKHINCLNLNFLIIILQKSLQPHDKKMLINQKIFIPVTRRKVNMTFYCVRYGVQNLCKCVLGSGLIGGCAKHDRSLWIVEYSDSAPD